MPVNMAEAPEERVVAVIAQLKKLTQKQAILTLLLVIGLTLNWTRTTFI